jgi:hypothetical protein
MTACLVFLDEFDGWVDLGPLPNYEATTVARALFAYVLRYGCPHLMWSGQDSELHNKVIELTCTLLKMKQMFTSSRSSNSLARQERVHRTCTVDKTTKEPDCCPIQPYTSLSWSFAFATSPTPSPV